MNGFWINIYKPHGINSTRVTNLIKRMFKPLKVGHAGTLDPMAEGLLPIAVGEATKTIEFLHQINKTYEFEIKFGKRTDSGDLEGKIIEENDIIPTKEEIEDSMKKFIGKIEQTPPKYSAIKIDGKRAYSLAREGIEFEMKKREVEIYNLELLNFEYDKASFRATVSLGTYIRTLAEDIASNAGAIGVVSVLKRVTYGMFNINNCLTPNLGENKNFTDDLHSFKESIIKHALPVDVVLDDIPVLHLDQTKTLRLRQGQRLKGDASDGFYRVYEEDNKFSLIVGSTGGILRPYKVFNL